MHTLLFRVQAISFNIISSDFEQNLMTGNDANVDLQRCTHNFDNDCACWGSCIQRTKSAVEQNNN